MIMGIVVLLNGNGASIYQEKYPIGKKYENDQLWRSRLLKRENTLDLNQQVFIKYFDISLGTGADKFQGHIVSVFGGLGNDACGRQ